MYLIFIQNGKKWTENIKVSRREISTYDFRNVYIYYIE